MDFRHLKKLIPMYRFMSGILTESLIRMLISARDLEMQVTESSVQNN